MNELLAAERRGRMFLFRNAGDPAANVRREQFIADNADGHALLAAARAAACLGIRMRVRLAAPGSPSRVWRALVPGCRHFAEVMDEIPAVSALKKDGAGESLVIPDESEAWRQPLSASAPRVVRDDGAGPTLSRAESRDIDRAAIGEYGIPGICLMENAALGAMAVALDMPGGKGHVIIVAGGGNNGGDGLAMARGFADLGIPVETALLKPVRTLTGDARTNYDLLKETAVPIRELSQQPEYLETMLKGKTLVVDALLGTGFRGGLTPAYLEAVDRINASGLPVLALDVPSGLDADSGEAAEAAVKATRTITFAAVKNGLRHASARSFVGDLFVGDIGFKP